MAVLLMFEGKVDPLPGPSGPSLEGLVPSCLLEAYFQSPQSWLRFSSRRAVLPLAEPKLSNRPRMGMLGCKVYLKSQSRPRAGMLDHKVYSKSSNRPRPRMLDCKVCSKFSSGPKIGILELQGYSKFSSRPKNAASRECRAD